MPAWMRSPMTYRCPAESSTKIEPQSAGPPVSLSSPWLPSIFPADPASWRRRSNVVFFGAAAAVLGSRLCLFGKRRGGEDRQLGGRQGPSAVHAATLVIADHVTGLDAERLLARRSVRRDLELDAPGHLILEVFDERQFGPGRLLVLDRLLGGNPVSVHLQAVRVEQVEARIARAITRGHRRLAVPVDVVAGVDPGSDLEGHEVSAASPRRARACTVVSSAFFDMEPRPRVLLLGRGGSGRRPGETGNQQGARVNHQEAQGRQARHRRPARKISTHVGVPEGRGVSRADPIRDEPARRTQSELFGPGPRSRLDRSSKDPIHRHPPAGHRRLGIGLFTLHEPGRSIAESGPWYFHTHSARGSTSQTTRVPARK